MIYLTEIADPNNQRFLKKNHGSDQGCPNFCIPLYVTLLDFTLLTAVCVPQRPVVNRMVRVKNLTVMVSLWQRRLYHYMQILITQEQQAFESKTKSDSNKALLEQLLHPGVAKIFGTCEELSAKNRLDQMLMYIHFADLPFFTLCCVECFIHFTSSYNMLVHFLFI